MIENGKVLAVVPARGGSKGVANKNIRMVAGKPLIAWTLAAASASKYMDRVVISSDDAQIIAVARQYGGDVPFTRPAELARDETPGIDPVLHAIGEIKGYDIVVVLQPTSPLRIGSDIDGCLEQLIVSNAMSCVAVTEAQNHPYWTYRTTETGRLAPFVELPSHHATRRQDLPRAFAINGAVYAARIPWLAIHKTFFDADTTAYEMPAERSLDIDTVDDLKLAEQALQARSK